MGGPEPAATAAADPGCVPRLVHPLANILDFSARNLPRLHLETLAGNAAALASYRKVGFLEGVLREQAFVAGQYVDTVVMGLLCSEWQGMQR